MSVSDTGPRPSATPGAPVHAAPPAPPRGARGRWILLAVFLAVLALVAWVVISNRHTKEEGGAGGRGGRGGRGGGVTSVNAAKTTTGDVPIYLSALGTVTPPATVTVRSQLAGQLLSVAFREGQEVSKGQLLAQVDPRPYQAALSQAQGALARDAAQLANARLDLNRFTTLLAQDSIAGQQVDTQRATVRQLEGTVEADKGAVNSARVNLGYTRITAPVAGRVGLRQVDPGNYVTNGDANGVVTITQVRPMDVVFTVPEDSVGQVMARVRTGARLTSTAFDRAGTEALEDGYLLTLDNQIDTTTGTVKAKARFSNAQGKLFPNQFVNLRLLVDTLHGAVLTPSSSVLRGQSGLFVYVVDPDRTVRMRTIKTGPAVGDVTAVTDGLQPGETVVTDGSDRLRDGAEVLLPGDCPPPEMLAGRGGGRGGRRHGHGGGRGGQGGAAARPGVGPDGQRCTPTPLSRGEGGRNGSARQQAMLDQLGLDAGQKAKVDQITAQSAPKLQAARASGDFEAMGVLRRTTTAQINAVLRPDQKAKYARLQAEQRAAFQGGGAGGSPAPAVAPAPVPASPAGAPVPSPAERARGGAPAVDVPPASGAPPSSGPHGSLKGPAPAATSTQPTGAGPVIDTPAPADAPRGGGGQAALLDGLGLDPGQRARAEAILADSRARAQAAYRSGDRDGARTARQDGFRKLDAILRPDQRAKLAAARERMRAERGGA